MKSRASVARNPVILAAVKNGEWRTHVQSKLSAYGVVAFVNDARDLPRVALNKAPDIVLWHLDPLVDWIDAYVAAFKDLRQVAPRSAVVAYGEVGHATAHLLFIAGRIGADRLLLRGFDDLERGVVEASRATPIETAIRETLKRLQVPEGAAAVVFEHCLRRTSAGPMSVQQLANALQVDRKTVSRWLRQAALPPPEQLISWCRMYWVARLLEDHRRSVADIARMLRFSSESDLRRMVARHTHRTPTLLREGGADVVLAAFSRGRAPEDARMPHWSTATPQ